MALKQLGSETLTLSSTSTAKTLTATYLISATTGNPTSVMMAALQLRAGGNVFELIHGTPDKDGGNGEQERSISEEWQIWGTDDMVGWEVILKNGESTAYIDVQYYGAP